LLQKSSLLDGPMRNFWRRRQLRIALQTRPSHSGSLFLVTEFIKNKMAADHDSGAHSSVAP
jgi:hypothetical protein